MLNQKLRISPNGTFTVYKLAESIAICEAKEDRYDWGNATDTEPAFIVYLGCRKSEVSGYIKTIQTFYRCDWCETRKSKYLKDFEVEIKIRGMQRETDTHAYGLDYLFQSELAKHPTNYTINYDNCIDDMAENFICAKPEYECVPLSIIKDYLFEAINNFTEDFSTNPEKYLSKYIYQRLEIDQKRYEQPDQDVA